MARPQGGARVSPQAAVRFEVMVERGLSVHLLAAAQPPQLRVGGPIEDAADARVHQRHRAHDARLAAVPAHTCARATTCT